MVLGSEYKLKYDMNENFILDLDKFRITTLCGKYRNISDIIDIDTLSNNVFLIKYNEQQENDSSIKTEITLILDLNFNNQKIIQTYYDVENNFTTLKTSSKKDLIVLTTD